MPAGVYKLHICGVLPIKEETVFSFGQTYPLKISFEGNLKSFFYIRERERESEFTRGIGWNFLSIMGIILAFLGEGVKT